MKNMLNLKPVKNTIMGIFSREEKEMPERILVVEDDEDFADLIGLLLTKKGYETKVTYNGKDAIEAASALFPSIILQDYMLADISGIDLLTRLKEASPDSHVIVITARGSEEVAVDVMKAGATDYLKKPFDTEKLLTTVDNTIRLRSSEAAIERLSQEFRVKNNELMALNAISSALVSLMTPEEKYKTSVGIVRKNMRADVANIFVSAGAGRKLNLVASEGLAGDEFTECNISKGKGLVSYVAEIKKTASLPSSEARNGSACRPKSMNAGLFPPAVPLLVRGKVMGVLAVYYKNERTFNSFEMKLIGNFANQIALSVKADYLSRLLGDLQRQWQVTLDAVPDRITLQDADHMIVMANKAAAKVAGLGVKDIIGQSAAGFPTSRAARRPPCKRIHKDA
jgi:DNA-binding response OmpR family regulator